MDTIVMKFGGSSVADNIRLNLVAEKIIEFSKKGENVVVVVSAQGKTTDGLIKEASELSAVPDDREMDVLLSAGEQISMSKLSILLNRMGYPAISLTGWQAGIYTNNTNQDAIIEHIDTTRINQELEKGKIVIVAGFQGINENMDIATLGRGGSDSTAVAIAAALKAKHCYIFSDVDGVYTTDPNKVKSAKKLSDLSYEEALDISSEGAKVLHNRCVEIAERFQIPLVAKSTFNDKPGTTVSDKIEETTVKSIVKNDDIIYVNAKGTTYTTEIFNKIYNCLIQHDIQVKHFANDSKEDLNLSFYIKKTLFSKFANLLEKELNMLQCKYHDVSRISIIGHGIMNNPDIIKEVMKIIETNKLDVSNIDVNESKIAVIFKDIVPNTILEQLHKEILE